ncbi:hypothetical protein [Terrabacter sp. Ter38]|uniref:hypothetical protein n=1 Tax=Terrabacter sp. Ter38 TaxID=2926030 RepID=UPI0021190393|nr:hypothetical protein [Terrabacter sp. Ter38]
MGYLDHQFDPGTPAGQYVVERLGSRYFEKQPIQELALAAGVQRDQIFWDQKASQLWIDVLETAWKQQRLRLLFIAISQDAGADRIFQELAAEPTDHEVVEIPPQSGQSHQPAAGAAAVAGAVVAVADAVGAMFTAAVLWDDVPLIDRTDLRGNVQRMLGPGGRRALLVNGPSGAGKTYTRQFIRYVSENAVPPHGTTTRVSPVDASRRAGSPIDVRELADTVARFVVGEPAPNFDPTAQPQTVVWLFKDWLVAEVAAKGDLQDCWLVFDGFERRTATAAALQLVMELAQSAAVRDLGRVRVIVLGYDDPLSEPDQALVEPLRHPGDDDVKSFIRAYATRAQGIPPDADAVDAVFDELVSDGGPVATRPLVELGPSAFALCLDVFGPLP